MSEDWEPDNHPPHSWPIGGASGWRIGYGCPTVWCKGYGAQREKPAGDENTQASKAGDRG